MAPCANVLQKLKKSKENTKFSTYIIERSNKNIGFNRIEAQHIDEFKMNSILKSIMITSAIKFTHSIGLVGLEQIGCMNIHFIRFNQLAA